MPYCTSIGRSSPYSLSNTACRVASMPRSPARVSIGSPGTRRIRKKASSVMPMKVGMIRLKRVNRKRSMARRVEIETRRESCQNEKSRLASALKVSSRSRLLEVFANQASHLEHGHLHLAEDFLQLGVGVDHALVDCVLQLVLLDVSPQLLHHLGAWQRTCAYDGRQSGAGRQGFHERCIGGAFFRRGLFCSWFFCRGGFLCRRSFFSWCRLFGRSLDGYLFCRCCLFCWCSFLGRRFFCSCHDLFSF